MRRTLAGTAAGLLMLGVLAGCSSDDITSKAVESASDGKVKIDKDNQKITVEGEDGKGSISFGAETDLPDNFPEDDVPLPEGGKVRAVINGERDGNEYFNITYEIDGGDVKSAASDYRGELEDDGYEIKSSTSIGSGDAGFTSFTAVGASWDVVVLSAGGSSGDDKAALSIQVMTHDPANETGS